MHALRTRRFWRTVLEAFASGGASLIWGSRVVPRGPRADPTFEELSETIAGYPDPDDKLTIALGNFNRVRAERDEVKKKWGGAEDLAVVWRERGLLAELERDAFKDALEYERSLNDSVVAPMRRALEEIAATTDVDMGGEYIIHNEPALSAVQASLRARKALHDIRSLDGRDDETVALEVANYRARVDDFAQGRHPDISTGTNQEREA